MVVIFLTKNSLYFTEDDCLPKDEEKPEETGETHDELFDAIASLFPDKGLTGAEVFRR